MNTTIERLYKEAFWSWFGGIAMFGYLIILPLDVIRAMTSVQSVSIPRLAVFIVFCGTALTLIALVLAWLIPLYANVMDSRERVKRLVQICRGGRRVMFYVNWPGFLWRKVLKPAGLYIGGGAVVAVLAFGLLLSSLTKANREEDEEDSWMDAFL